MNTRAQSLRPLELLLYLGIFFFATLLLFLFSSAQNTEHERSINTIAISTGGAHILTQLLGTPINGTRAIDLLRTNDPDSAAHIRTYMRQYEPSITRYELYRNDQRVIAENTVTTPVRTSITIDNINITLVYQK